MDAPMKQLRPCQQWASQLMLKLLTFQPSAPSIVSGKTLAATNVPMMVAQDPTMNTRRSLPVSKKTRLHRAPRCMFGMAARMQCSCL
jgi:hypothetical protein